MIVKIAAVPIIRVRTLCSLPPFRGMGHEAVGQKLNSPLPTKRSGGSSPESEVCQSALPRQASKSAHPASLIPAHTHMTLTNTVSPPSHSHPHPSHELEEPWGALVPVLLFFCFAFLHLLCFDLKSVFGMTRDHFFFMLLVVLRREEVRTASSILAMPASPR